MHRTTEIGLKLLPLLMPLFLILGCSDNSTGPDNSGDNGNDPTPTTLIAEAGDDSDEIVGIQVTADGSESDGEGNLTYSWTLISQPENSNATLSNAGTVNPSFIPDFPGEYTLELEVTAGDETEADSVTFSAIAKRLFVDANTGTEGDIYGYLENSPLKTITSAQARFYENAENEYLDIDTIFVAEGLYDETNGESFPLSFSGDLLILGDEDVSRNEVHILSPDVDREPTIELGEGVTLRHFHIENGYTGGTFNGDPDAVYIRSGSSLDSSKVQLENVTLSINHDYGYILSTGSNIHVEVSGTDGKRSLLDGKGIGQAYTNRFNTSNVRMDLNNTDVVGIGEDDAFLFEPSYNGNLYLTNTTIKPSGSTLQDNAAIEIAGGGNIVLENTTITSSDETEAGNRFKYAIDMDADHADAHVEITNSTLQFTTWSAIEMYASVFEITDSIIEGIHTQETDDGANLAHNGINQLDGTLILRGTTIRNSNGNAITVDGPSSPNGNDFMVDLGTEDAPGQNIFQNIDGFDVLVGRGDSDVSGEIPALGNTWSNGSAAPTCGTELPGSSENASKEVYVSTNQNSLRWGESAGEICSR